MVKDLESGIPDKTRQSDGRRSKNESRILTSTSTRPILEQPEEPQGLQGEYILRRKSNHL